MRARSSATAMGNAALLVFTTMLAFAAMLVAREASAHPIGLSRGEYRNTADGVDVELTFGRVDAVVLVPSLDTNGDDALDEGEIASARAELTEHIVARVRVLAGTEGCSGSLLSAALTESDALVVRAHYRCEHPPAASASIDLLDDLPRGHRHAIHATTGARSTDDLCFLEHRTFTFPEGGVTEGRAEGVGRPWAWQAALRFTGMGFAHVLRGYDHLVFLFALLLVGGRVRSLLSTTSAFTLGHSVTLAMATLGLVAVPPRIVECAIALSIAYVGVENLMTPRTDRRWRLTLMFGMVHGLGFAGALAELGLSRAEIVPALVTFNVGVELAQLVAMAVFVPLVWGLRALGPATERVVPAISLLIAACGLLWFVDRVQSAPVALEAVGAGPSVAQRQSR